MTPPATPVRHGSSTFNNILNSPEFLHDSEQTNVKSDRGERMSVCASQLEDEMKMMKERPTLEILTSDMHGGLLPVQSVKHNVSQKMAQVCGFRRRILPPFFRSMPSTASVFSSFRSKLCYLSLTTKLKTRLGFCRIGVSDIGVARFRFEPFRSVLIVPFFVV